MDQSIVIKEVDETLSNVTDNSSDKEDIFIEEMEEC